MNAFELPGDPPVEITVRRSNRARRYALRISNVGSVVSLTLPAGAPLAKAISFAKSREDWIRAKLLNSPVAKPVQFGDVFLYRGQQVTLRPAQDARNHITDDALFIAANDATLGVKLKAMCKSIARIRPTTAYTIFIVLRL